LIYCHFLDCVFVTVIKRSFKKCSASTCVLSSACIQALLYRWQLQHCGSAGDFLGHPGNEFQSSIPEENKSKGYFLCITLIGWSQFCQYLVMKEGDPENGFTCKLRMQLTPKVPHNRAG